MLAYIVTGRIAWCFSSRWGDMMDVRVKVGAQNEREAINMALALYEDAARKQDPEATVCWLGTPHASLALLSGRTEALQSIIDQLGALLTKDTIRDRIHQDVAALHLALADLAERWRTEDDPPNAGRAFQRQLDQDHKGTLRRFFRLTREHQDLLARALIAYHGEGGWTAGGLIDGWREYLETEDGRIPMHNPSTGQVSDTTHYSTLTEIHQNSVAPQRP